MIAVLHHDDIACAGPVLERHFHRKAAVKTIADAGQIARRNLGQLGGQFQQRDGVEIGSGMSDVAQLSDGGLDHAVIIGTKAVDQACKVQSS